MPRIDELIHQLGGAQFISTLDLTRGYWRRLVQGFTYSKWQQFCIVLRQYGLPSCLSKLAQILDKIFLCISMCTLAMRILTSAFLVVAGMPVEMYGERKSAYHTYVNFTAPTEHEDYSAEILQKLSGAGLTAKPAKSKLGAKECVYLGHTVGNGDG
jgi:hypothetical protein